MSFTKEELLRNLNKTKEEGKTYFTFQTNVYLMVCDVIDYLENSNLAKENERLQSQLLEYQRVCSQKQEIIEELQANPPLKFEELKEGMWIWDNKWKEFRCIRHVSIKYRRLGFALYHTDWINFEKNRFYRREVKQNG